MLPGDELEASGMRIITGVLGLTHVPQRMNNVPQRPEEKGRVPVPLVARWGRPRPELIGSGVKDGELVLGVVRAPAPAAPGPRGGRERGAGGERGELGGRRVR